MLREISISSNAHSDAAFEEILLPVDVKINAMAAELGIPAMVPLNLPEIPKRTRA